MLVIAITVALAILGTTLAAMNTGVRISFAMAQDSEMPGIMGLLHSRYATPTWAVVIMVIVSAGIGTHRRGGGCHGPDRHRTGFKPGHIHSLCIDLRHYYGGLRWKE